ncbi:malonyl CoA-acyl carrier protein transacylase [Lachnospiraceae bacterium]|nr:malonyl CoA-acyl carrier protein transacylase [Lachnospiraceae bacterium]
MSKIAFIYPGQGAQKAGMGADFYDGCRTAGELYDAAEQALGLDMKHLCFEENDKLDLTEYTQAALVTTCLAMTRAVREAGIAPDITAGLSLGEYAAIAASGGMDELDAIRLVRKRGILMQNTVPAGVGAMCAVMGMETARIEEILLSTEGAEIANYNCPGQIVITGYKEAVETAAQRLKEAGAKRTVMLNVSGPFHSPLLIPAGEALSEELSKVTLHDLRIPYVTNVSAEKVDDISRTKELLARQVSSPVRWQQSMELMISEGVDYFVEIGPGRTLAGFMKKISRDVTVYHISTWEDVGKVAGELC